MSNKKTINKGLYIQIPYLKTEKKQKKTESKLFEKQC